ncbi:MAG: queuosine precursor transporter [Archaeoglobaceae archaeon]|nr:queuosine precursor transporter [Archaeoglobaceae archaeon]
MLFAEFIQWVLVTLGIVTVTMILAERYGVEIAIGIFTALIVIANVISSKIIFVGEIGSVNLIGPAGVIVYASTFLITDIIGEIYGKEYSKKAVITGFFANIIAVIAILIAINWTPAPFLSNEFLNSFNKILGFAPRIVLASMIAYLISQTHDVYAFHFWKRKTKGRHLWLRNNASTIVSQAIDTAVFITIAFYGLVANEVLLSMIFGQYVLKVFIALFDTPFIYIATLTWRWKASLDS